MDRMERIKQYRSIRYQRTYRTLGRMSVWRVVLGALLLIYVLFMSGFVSKSLASREKFIAAKACMLAPKWMESYKPQEKAFYEAGVLYEQGDYEAAFEAFGEIELDAAVIMRSMCRVRQAQLCLDMGDKRAAREYILSADESVLDGDYLTQYKQCYEKACG